VKPDTVWGWVQEWGGQCKTFAEVAADLRPTWDGYGLADGRTVRIRGVKYALCLTADEGTQDVPQAGLFAHEDYRAWQTTFLALKALAYPLKGLTLDDDPALWAAAVAVFPDVPRQLCLVHVMRQMRRWLKYTARIPIVVHKPFLDLCQRLCYAVNHAHLARLHAEWQTARPQYLREGLADAVAQFESKFPVLWTYLDYPGMPRTSNVIEAVIRQLGRKLDDTDGFQTPGTAWATIQLLLMRYRFHPFSCSRIQRHNGESPLNLAGVNTQELDWVRFAQRLARPPT
jgi:transposase-like protein